MASVKVRITKLVDDSVPGFVEFELTDIYGKPHRFMDKVPVICDHYEYTKQEITFLPNGTMGCMIIEEKENSYIIDTQLPWDIESYEGEYRFEVSKDLVKL